jgi:hypothetical protein
VPLLFALLLTIAATLILGIVPGKVLENAKAAAQTYTSVNGSAAQPAETAQR